MLESKGYYIFSLASHASNKTKSVFLFVQRSEEKTYFCLKILLLAHPRFLFFKWFCFYLTQNRNLFLSFFFNTFFLPRVLYQNFKQFCALLIFAFLENTFFLNFVQKKKVVQNYENKTASLCLN